MATGGSMQEEEDNDACFCVIISTIYVSGHIHNIREREESSIKASKKEHELLHAKPNHQQTHSLAVNSPDNSLL